VYATPDEPAEDDGAAASPCGFGPVDQDKLEVLVRDRAREVGADLRFFAEMTSFTQSADGVTAAVTNRGSGASEIIQADYLVAADGAGSPVRHALGIEAGGPGLMFTTLTAIVDADLTSALRGRAVTIAYLQRPRPFTILMAHDEAGQRWVFGTGYDPDREPLASFTDDRVADMVRAAAGLAEVEVRLRPQIPGTT
jgi:putative polyketide hydroxylase